MNVTAEGYAFPVARFVAGERVSTVSYARALDLEDPLLVDVHAARAAGYAARPVVPAMLGFFLTVPGDALVEDLGFTWGRTLNAGIELEWRGIPVTEEDTIEGRTTVEAAWERPASHGGIRQFLRLRTDFSVDGKPACRWKALFIEKRDAPTQGEAIPDADPGSGDATDLLDGAVPAEDPGGLELPSHSTGIIDRLTLARLSVALDNPDPLHLDDDVARDAGFDQVIGQGSAVVGLLHEPVRRWAGCQAPVRLATRQRLPFTLGDTLSASGQVSGRDDGCVACTTSVRNAAGQVVGSADIDVVLVRP